MAVAIRISSTLLTGTAVHKRSIDRQGAPGYLGTGIAVEPVPGFIDLSALTCRRQTCYYQSLKQSSATGLWLNWQGIGSRDMFPVKWLRLDLNSYSVLPYIDFPPPPMQKLELCISTMINTTSANGVPGGGWAVWPRERPQVPHKFVCRSYESLYSDLRLALQLSKAVRNLLQVCQSLALITAHRSTAELLAAHLKTAFIEVPAYATCEPGLSIYLVTDVAAYLSMPFG